jgi:hypothetical protein
VGTGTSVGDGGANGAAMGRRVSLSKSRSAKSSNPGDVGGISVGTGNSTCTSPPKWSSKSPSNESTPGDVGGCMYARSPGTGTCPKAPTSPSKDSSPGDVGGNGSSVGTGTSVGERTSPPGGADGTGTVSSSDPGNPG